MIVEILIYVKIKPFYHKHCDKNDMRMMKKCISLQRRKTKG